MSEAKPSVLSLKRRVLGAGFWSLAGFGLSYSIRLVSSLLMTRLLVPEMFGVMAIATMIMVGLAMFSNIGLKPNIVQSARGSDPAFLNTAWIIQIVRGVVLWVLAICIALLILVADRLGLMPKGTVYADPLLPYVIAVVSISTVIGAFQSTKVSEASRHLSLGRVTQMQAVAQVCGLICMLTWAAFDRSIWALVAGGICSSIVTTLLSHVWLPGIPNHWQWDRSAFREIFQFAKWMFLSTLLGFFANNADRMLLGGLVDSATLGIYSVAFTLVSAFAQILNKLISDVSFSAFSEVARDRLGDLRRSLYRFHVLTASFTYFCAGLLIVSSDVLIRLMYDPRYHDAGWMLAVLAVGLLAVPINLAIYALLARGLPKIFTNLIAVRALATFLAIPVGFYLFGLSGALWGIVVSQLSIVPASIYYQIKYDLFDLSKEIILLPAVVGGMLLGKAVNIALGM